MILLLWYSRQFFFLLIHAFIGHLFYILLSFLRKTNDYHIKNVFIKYILYKLIIIRIVNYCILLCLN